MSRSLPGHMTAIACVSQNFGIGRNNELLFDIDLDKKWFKEKTEYHTVVMGYNTYLSLPGKRPLPNRHNVVLSRSHMASSGFTTYHSLDELLHNVNQYDTYVIGGGQIYRALLPYCSYIYLTRVLLHREADATFPDMDIEPGWKCVLDNKACGHDRMSREGVFIRQQVYLRR